MSPELELPLFRKSDPETSRRAAESAQQLRASDHAKILAFLDTQGSIGGSYREIALATGLEPVAVGRRMSELTPPSKCPECKEQNVKEYDAGGWMCWTCGTKGQAKVVVVGERKLSTGRAGRIFVRVA